VKRVQIVYLAGRFWVETIIMYRHHWRPKPKGVEHEMHWGDGQAMWCKCGRTFR
jgi:hypothetical protein